MEGKTQLFSPTKLTQIAVIVLAFVAGFLGSVIFLKYFNKKEPVKSVQKPQFDIPGAVTLPTTTTYNFAVLGYGGEGHDGGYLTDVIMVANINPDTKSVHLFSIPRDLWVSVPVRSDLKEKHKINSAFAIGMSDSLYPLKEPRFKGKEGAGELTKSVLEDVTGLKIEHFLAVNFGNFRKIIDTLEGINVNVPVAFNDKFYPVKGLENETCGFSPEQIAEFHQKYSGFDLEKQFVCRYEQINFNAGKVTMDGETTLKFVRSRHSDTYGGDFSRSERQNAVLLGVKEKLISVSAVKSARELYNEFLGLIQTDLDIETFGGFFKLLGNPEGYKVSFKSINTDNVLVNGKSADGQFILLPKDGSEDWTGLKNYINGELKKPIP